MTDCLWKPFFDYNLPQTLSNLIYLTILVTLRPSTLFSPKDRASKVQKKSKSLLDNCCFHLFTELEIWY